VQFSTPTQVLRSAAPRVQDRPQPKLSLNGDPQMNFTCIWMSSTTFSYIYRCLALLSFLNLKSLTLTSSVFSAPSADNSPKKLRRYPSKEQNRRPGDPGAITHRHQSIRPRPINLRFQHFPASKIALSAVVSGEVVEFKFSRLPDSEFCKSLILQPQADRNRSQQQTPNLDRTKAAFIVTDLPAI